jgi:hypothetical protein
VTAVSPYSWSDKTKAVQLYMLNGNMRIVSEVTSVPYDTLCDWKKQEWWATVVDELRAAAKAKRGTKLSHIVDVSLELVQDRLEKGDWIYNQKTGQLVRKPVSLRDVAQVTNNLMDKQIQLETLADKVDNNKTTVQETLAMLAKEFQKLNRNKQKTDAVDAVIKELPDALHDEWEEGLQEGSGEVHLKTRSEEETS